MQGFGLLVTTIIGGIAGWIAEKVMRSKMGIFGNIVIGIVGAYVVNAILFSVVHTTLRGVIGQSIVSIIGACILIIGWRLVSKYTRLEPRGHTDQHT